MDLLEIYDARNQPLGFTKPKKEAHRDGDWHRTSEIVVLNEKQDVLLTLRHPDKLVLPNFWDVCVGGHVDPGESYVACAIREVEGRNRRSTENRELIYSGMVAVEAIDEAVSLIDREHAAVYLFHTNRTLDQFVMQFDEVADLRFVPLVTLLEELRSGFHSLSYTPPNATYLQTLEMVETYLQNNG